MNIEVTLYYDGTSCRVQSAVVLSNTILTSHAGYHGDLNETYPVGEIDEDSKKLLKTTRLALDESIKICKPGALIRDIGKVM